MNFFLKIVAGILVVGCVTAHNTAAERRGDRPAPARGEERADAITHYIAGEIYRTRGDFRSWVSELEEAAGRDRGALDLQLRLVGAYRLFKQHDKAIDLAERTLENHPDAIPAYVWLGRLYYENDELDRSMETFEKAVAIDPSSGLALEALAKLKEQINDLVSEVELYEKLVVVAPDSAEVHRELGASLYELGAYAEARDAYLRALELDPEATRTHYLLGVTYLELADYDEAIHQFENFLSEMPDHPQGQVNLAVCFARKQNFARAGTVLDGVIESAGVEPQHHLYRMYLLLRESGTPDASLAIAPSSAPIFGSLLKALVRKRAGEPYDRIVNSLDAVDGDLDLETTQYLNNLIMMFGDTAGEHLAEEFEALRKDGYSSRALDTFLGRTYMSIDQPERAETVLTSILDTFGEDKWTHYYLASVMEEQERPNQAARHLRAALELDPDDPDIMNFLGYLYAEEDMQLDEAETLLNQALEIDPDNGFYLDSLGWVYYRKGQAERAVDYIERAILNMSQDDAILRDHLGDAYALQGDIARALEEWRRAQRLDPELEGVAEKIRAHSE